jgi:hypothetical protein
MLLSYRKKFLYVHIYKVAGTSITKSLRSTGFNFYEMLEYKTLTKLNFSPRYCPLPHHPKAIDIRNEIGITKYNKLFKFTFVRNPWDWQVSLYNFMLQNKNHFQHNLVREMNFEEYIDWKITQKYDLQKDFITDDNGEIIVDFIGKFENLNSDFQKIGKHIDLSLELPHLNQSKRKKDYRSYYNKRNKELIAKYFEEDIDLFEYSF